MITMVVLSVDWNRPMWALFMILTAAVMIAVVCNMHKWIWRK